MGGLLILISMAAATVSFISLIRPLPGLWLPTRKRAAIAWVASFVLLFIGAALSPNPKPEKLAPPTEVASEVTGVVANREEDTDAMNIGNNEQETACIPRELSAAATELVQLYDQLHTFKDDTAFLDRGFSQAGPYYAWMETVKAHQDANPGWVLFDELGFAGNEVLMLGMDYTYEDPGASALSAIEFFETKIQAGLALTRCVEPRTAVQDIARTSAEARRAYVNPLARPTAGADDIDERVLNPCIAAGIARNPELDGVTPWEIRNIYPEIYDPLVVQLRAQAAPILVEFGDDARARNILLDRFRDDCIRGAHGETEPVDWSEAKVRELLSIPQEEATQLPGASPASAP